MNVKPNLNVPHGLWSWENCTWVQMRDLTASPLKPPLSESALSFTTAKLAVLAIPDVQRLSGLARMYARPLKDEDCEDAHPVHGTIYLEDEASLEMARSIR